MIWKWYQGQGFTALPGIFTIVGCLVVNQVAYVLAIRLNDDQSGGAAEDSPEQRANGVPRDDRNDDVRHKDSKNRQKSPTPSQFAWGAVLTCRTCGRRRSAQEFVHQKSSYKGW